MLHVTDDSPRRLSLHLADEAETLALGAALAPALRPGLVIHLCGDLGVGKTTLVRGLLRALGYTGAVKSPTYTLVELYAISRLDLYHFDFYRFRRSEEYLDAGLDEYFSEKGVCVVEWPEKAGTYGARADLRVDLVHEGSERRATVQAINAGGLECLNVLRASLKLPGSPST